MSKFKAIMNKSLGILAIVTLLGLVQTQTSFASSNSLFYLRSVATHQYITVQPNGQLSLQPKGAPGIQTFAGQSPGRIVISPNRYIGLYNGKPWSVAGSNPTSYLLGRMHDYHGMWYKAVSFSDGTQVVHLVANSSGRLTTSKNWPGHKRSIFAIVY